MKIINYLLFMLSGFILTSCLHEAEIIIRNDVHNVRLEYISYGDYLIEYFLLPGETSEVFEIKEFKESFPMSNQLEFYMVGNGNTVFLKTQERYELNIGQKLHIVISDTTKVLNPLLE